MITRKLWLVIVLVLCIPAFPSKAQQQARIQEFSPQGTVQRIRQIRVRFSEPMVSFGDPRAALSPFAIGCPEKGTGRWVDSVNWSYDFERDLPAGIRCEFNLRDDLKSLAGSAITGQRRFQFSSGGPAIVQSSPYQGSESISDDQIFVLELNGPTVESSVLSNVSFSVKGISEKVGIRIVSGQEKEEILNALYPLRYHRKRPDNLLLIQAKQKFPAKSLVNLIWGAGVLSPTGVATSQDQVLPFTTSIPFAASFHCQRENPDAQCVPVSAMHLSFSAPVLWVSAKNISLKGPGGKVWAARSQESHSTQDGERTVHGVTFRPPFPENASFTIEIPEGMEDETRHRLTNAGSFPLTVRTDEYPALAKFAARFGILELKSDPVLPVTLRNIEPELSGKIFEAEGGEDNFDPIPLQPGFAPVRGDLRGRILKIPSDKANQMLAWVNKVSQRGWEDRDKSIFGPVTAPKAKPFKLPRIHGGKAFEVVGIPLREPGFYVVEIESEMLGASLLGKSAPMYVPTTVLVTNLSVHFKWGTESSLIWVTSLDKAAPVPQAKLEVRDCEGKLHWQGTTDASGIARINALPLARTLPSCTGNSFSYGRGGLLATAQINNDMSFVHSGWNEGIENWRFGVPTEWRPNLQASHTILDRSLFRAGETVHMKHVLRRKALAGFALNPSGQEPRTVVIRHFGSDQKYELPLKWDAAGIAETTWSIPKEGRLGTYQIYFQTPSENDASAMEEYEYMPGMQNTGSFRVEEFRIPQMRAVIRPPSEPLVSPSGIPVDLTVSYLSGGGAAGLPVKFRYDLKPRYVWGIEGFEDYAFSNGGVKEGVIRGETEQNENREMVLKSSDLNLDKSGSTRTTITELPSVNTPMQVLAELEFRDPNGEIQTASSSIPVWPSSRLIGIRPDSWMQSKESLKFNVAVLDLNHKPVANASVNVILFQRKTYSHRKRLVGGFYAYENYTEVKRLGTLCDGKTNNKGLLICTSSAPASGELILQASTRDEAGRTAVANRATWIAGGDEWWFAARDDDRIDLLPEKKRYEPGQKARFQVRMPFRKGTALISIEREGVGETFVKEISGKEPVIEIPVKGSYAPNIFVSVLVVRGRIGGTKPTATVDLGRPAYKLGISEINVGWNTHELKVKVSADRAQYGVREKAKVQIAVTAPDGTPPAKGAEVALAAVDEGLLELMPNNSWQLLDAMMGRRSYNVQTSTAQMHVIGKRHFGLKALPQGGGGGSQITRELFDTLLLWKGRISLDEKGLATVEVPLNDSLTSFRIVAIATAGIDRFGTGSTTIRSTRDLILFSGIAPVVRQGDTFRSTFTLRNTTERALSVRVNTNVSGLKEALKPQTVDLGSGESKDLFWDLTAPAGVDSLRYQIEASAEGGISDRLSVTQKIVPAIPVRTMQATLTQIAGEYRVEVERPRDAFPGMGGIDVSLKPKLVEGMTGVSSYMRRYPYTCLEQLVSKAVALRDTSLWNRIAAEMPAYVDSEGLLKHFPMMSLGSDSLTAYVLSISREAGLEIPSGVKGQMIEGLRGFVQGRVLRYSALPTVDLSVRKLAAIAALSGAAQADADLLASITIEPNLWPTSALIDWLEVLQRVPSVRNRDARLREAEQIMRARLNFQGTTLTFSTERADCLWWLMVSPDENAVRLVLNALESPNWKPDIPRLVRGALGRQKRGHWDTTVANAWGVLTMEKFSKLFENIPVTGSSTVSLADASQILNWSESSQGKDFAFPWPQQRSTLTLHMAGAGQPWATIRSLAAIPLNEPVSTGFKIKKSMTAVEQKDRGLWSRGDILRVRLELEAQSDMTWIVVDDPIPAGATILGSGLGRDSRLATRGEKQEGWFWPAFEERSFEAFRAYYEFVPKGSWVIEYTVRLNNEGTMHMPPTRAEAMYSPEMFGELPNQPIQIR
jgi:alpha-2-macroglobulin